VDSLTVGLVTVCRVKFAGETRDAVASLYPAAEEARITCAIVDAAAKVRDPNRCHHPEGMTAISRGLRSASRDDTPGGRSQMPRTLKGCQKRRHCHHPVCDPYRVVPIFWDVIRG